MQKHFDFKSYTCVCMCTEKNNWNIQALSTDTELQINDDKLRQYIPYFVMSKYLLNMSKNKYFVCGMN